MNQDEPVADVADAEKGFTRPTLVFSAGMMNQPEASALRDLADWYAGIVRATAREHAMDANRLPIFGSCSFYFFLASDGVFMIITRASGTNREFASRHEEDLDFVSVDSRRWLRTQVDERELATVRFDMDRREGAEESLIAQANDYVGAIQLQQKTDGLVDIAALNGIEAEFEAFLEDHPDVSRNVFVMMRFQGTEQLEAAYRTIVQTLRERGLRAIRADKRNYSSALWDNIRVYLNGCSYGIALFEEIDSREFNPNVALELGFMLAQGKRVLPLKEKHMPKMPTDLVSHIYREWNSYKIEETVPEQVGEWLDTDLRIGSKATSPDAY